METHIHRFADEAFRFPWAVATFLGYNLPREGCIILEHYLEVSPRTPNGRQVLIFKSKRNLESYLMSGTLTLYANQAPCSGSCDNWDLKDITVTFSDHANRIDYKRVLVASGASGSCLARPRARPDATAVKFDLNGSNGHSYLDRTASEKGKIT
jgi:hypothetical protein